MTDLSIIRIEPDGDRVYADTTFHSGIDVDDDEYDTGTFTDRTYDVRDFDSIFIDLLNSGSNSVDVRILGSHKHFYDLTDLADADFRETEVAEETITAGNKISSPYTYIDVTKRLTALRIQAKETTDTNDSTLVGWIRATKRL